MARWTAYFGRPGVGAAFGLSFCVAPSVAAAQAAAYSVIHDFSATPIGAIYGDLVADAQGRLVGTGNGNLFQGTYGGVFRLTPPPGGSGPWTMSTIFTFPDTFTDGDGPVGGATVLGDAIFGTNQSGGALGYGTIFKLNAGRIVSVLYDFQAPPYDGNDPNGVVQGLSRRLYGTTSSGGYRDEGGIVFSVNPFGSNPDYKVLHRFGHDGDGRDPGQGRLAVDPQGRMFGVTSESTSPSFAGNVFMMQRISGHWQEQIIYNFTVDSVFYSPDENVALDGAGNLYGCAPGQQNEPGGIFRLAPPAQVGGAWTYSVLYLFGTQPNDPVGGACSVTVDPGTGKLFGVSYGGGVYNDGTIWELDPPATPTAAWTETVLHSFDGSATDGAHPEAAPFKLGNSYYGGNVSGIVYKFTP